MRWTNHNAGVGYSAGPNFFEEHTLSRNESVTDIDCLNYPSSVWSNLVYKLSGGDKNLIISLLIYVLLIC